MQPWHELFPKDQQPSFEQIAEYIGDARSLWQGLIDHMDAAYKARPKPTYSGCAGQPGWNVKFAKRGQSLGTFYPQRAAFSALVVIAYRHDPVMEAIVPDLTPRTAELDRQADDFMKIGKWMMLTVEDQATLEDIKKLVAVKFPPKPPIVG